MTPLAFCQIQKAAQAEIYATYYAGKILGARQELNNRWFIGLDQQQTTVIGASPVVAVPNVAPASCR